MKCEWLVRVVIFECHSIFIIFVIIGDCRAVIFLGGLREYVGDRVRVVIDVMTIVEGTNYVCVRLPPIPFIVAFSFEIRIFSSIFIFF